MIKIVGAHHYSVDVKRILEWCTGVVGYMTNMVHCKCKSMQCMYMYTTVTVYILYVTINNYVGL